MVSDTIRFDKETVETSNNATVPVPYELLETVHVTSGMEALVLLTNGVQSELFVNPVLNTSDPHISVPEEVLVTESFIGEQLTYWVTIPEKFDEINLVDGTISFGDEITGTPSDPTGGTWLFLSHRDFGYSEANDRVKGEITIYKTPYREYLQYGGNAELDVKCQHHETTIETTAEVYKNRKGFNIIKQYRDELGITKDDRRVSVWVHTDSIAATDNPDQGAEDLEDAWTHTETDTAETPHTDTETPSLTPESDDPQETTVQDKTDTEPANYSQQQHTESQSTAEAEETDEQHTPIQELVAGLDVEAEVNPDFVPVVLLDDDERTRDDWRGHYLTDSGELLCGRSYTDYAEDSDQTHHTDICHACAIERPGALPEHDLSLLLEKFTGLTFTDDLPFVLDRRDAALLTAQFILQYSNEEFKQIERYADANDISIMDAYREVMKAGINQIK